MAIENILERVNNIVIKIGTAGITTQDNGINKNVIGKLAKSCSELLDSGKNVYIVTSGAIACGKGEVKNCKSNNTERLAAIGQPILMNAYREAFRKYGKLAGQILLTEDNFDSRKRLALLKETSKELLQNKDIPIINENDVISTDEITFGDNDILAAKVTVDLNNDILLNLTVYDCLINNEGRSVFTGKSYDLKDYADLRKETVRKGSGGLESKLKSAKMCTDNGKICRIGNANKDIMDILYGKVSSTTFYPS